MQFWVKYMNNTNDILDRQAIYTRKYSLFDLIHTFMSIEGLQSLTGVSQVTSNQTFGLEKNRVSISISN